MPYLQLDLNGHYPAAIKQQLAAKMSATYARIMSVDARRISVAFRELGDGNVWRVAEAGGDPVRVAVMMLDIRRGRSAEPRMEVAKALFAHCVEIMDLRRQIECRVHAAFRRRDVPPNIGWLQPGMDGRRSLTTDWRLL